MSLLDVTTATGTIVCKPVIGPFDILKKLEMDVALTAGVIPGRTIRVLPVPCEKAVVGIRGAIIGEPLVLTGAASTVTCPEFGGCRVLTGATGLGAYGVSGSPFVGLDEMTEQFAIKKILAKLGGGIVPGQVIPRGLGGVIPGVTGLGGVIPGVTGLGGVIPGVTGLGGVIPGVTGLGGVIPGVTGLGGVIPGVTGFEGEGIYPRIPTWETPFAPKVGPIVKKITGPLDIHPESLIYAPVIAPGKIVAGDLLNTTVAMPFAMSNIAATAPGTGYGMPYGLGEPTMIPRTSFLEKAKTMLF